MVTEGIELDITQVRTYHRETEFFLENSVSGVLE